MHRAIVLSKNSVKTGGPFGAVIAKDGIIIAEASNSVTIDLDPTAHAEVNCIRQATRKLKTFNLEGCEIYTSCEPCPMCLGAIYWAHLDRIYYANDRKDAAKIGFDDEFIYEEIDRKIEDRHKPMIALMSDEALGAFRMWEENAEKRQSINEIKIKREGCTEYELQPSFLRFFLYSIMRDREKWKRTISQIFFVILPPNSEKTLN